MFGERSFFVAASKLWSDLADHIRSSETISIFKSTILDKNLGTGLVFSSNPHPPHAMLRPILYVLNLRTKHLSQHCKGGKGVQSAICPKDIVKDCLYMLCKKCSFVTLVLYSRTASSVVKIATSFNLFHHGCLQNQ